MNAEQLSKVGSDLVRRCGTRDPFQIANALGINVMDDCENLGSLKGMYFLRIRERLSGKFYSRSNISTLILNHGIFQLLLRLSLTSQWLSSI